MKKWSLPWLSLLFALPLGCAGEPSAPVGPAATGGSQKVFKAADYSVMKPAFQTEEEKKRAGKADEASDYRQANPEWYAITDAPAGKNFRAMVEWEPMQILLTTYSDGMNTVPPVRQTILDIVYHTVVDAETKAGVIVTGATAKNDFTKGLKDKGLDQAAIDSMVEYIEMPNDTIWHIDYGPLPIVDTDTNNVAFADFRYYHPRYLDDAIPSRLAKEKFGVTTYRMPFDIEGGTFQATGEGTCFTAERALLYSGATKDELGAVWKDYLNCQQLVIMKDITDDGTGHIDMFYKQASKNVAIIGEYKDVYVKDATNKKRMDDNVALLESTPLLDGSSMTVKRLPFPGKAKTDEGDVPRTYLNSTIVNGANLWPMYSDDKEAEAEALAAWKDAMPDHQHIGILSDQIALWSGTIHCVTRTIPQGNLAPWVPDGECAEGQCANEDPNAYSGACYGPESSWCWGPTWQCECNICNEDGSCVEVVSSCEGYCGGQSPAGCYCDDLCSQYGDCCDDYVEICGGTTPGDGSCKGVCGSDQPQEGNCYCDGACEQYGDCCSDYATECGGTTPAGCGDVTFEGCCSEDGGTLSYCENDQLQSGPCEGGCGWDPENNFYNCGFTGADPSGANPLTCSGEGPCEPSCAEKECGPDGCGGVCGKCTEGTICKSGMCELPPCQPKCDGKACGADGCGSSCGTCEGDLSCKAGVCEEGPCEGSCDGLTCGDDGCGNDCGACQGGEACEAGQCIAVCTPDCEGMSCGDDGCGGTCGTCDAGELCQADGTCMAEPLSDSCDGVCGGAAPSGCGCDDQCEANDNCCPDVCDVCPEMCAPPIGEDTGTPSVDAGGTGGEDTGTGNPGTDDTVGGNVDTGAGGAINTDTAGGGTGSGSGSGAGAGTGGGGSSGGCSTSHGTTAPGWAILLLVALSGLFVIRRRRVA